MVFRTYVQYFTSVNLMDLHGELNMHFIQCNIPHCTLKLDTIMICTICSSFNLKLKEVNQIEDTEGRKSNWSEAWGWQTQDSNPGICLLWDTYPLPSSVNKFQSLLSINPVISKTFQGGLETELQFQLSDIQVGDKERVVIPNFWGGLIEVEHVLFGTVRKILEGWHSVGNGDHNKVYIHWSQLVGWEEWTNGDSGLSNALNPCLGFRYCFLGSEGDLQTSSSLCVVGMEPGTMSSGLSMLAGSWR